MFERIRTIKGRRYRYREERWREGGKVKSKSWCLGKVEMVDALGWGMIDQQMAQYPSDRAASDKESAPENGSAVGPDSETSEN